MKIIQIKKNLKPRYWIFFAFHIALDLISGRIKKKKKKFEDPYEKS
jgi:hypothetical protein